MKKAKRILATMLVALLLVTSAPLAGFVGLELPKLGLSASAVSSGQCGENVYWNYDEQTRTLIINGNGFIDYYYFWTVPWHSLNEFIEFVEIKGDVRDIENIYLDSFTLLKRINVNENNSYYTTDENGILYNKDKTKLIQFPRNSEMITFVVPDTVNSLRPGAFANCYNIKKIILPDSIREIPTSSFYLCKSLEEINIPNSVTKIGYTAFYFCSKIKDIKLPENLTIIGGNAFVGCSSLERIEIPESVKEIGKGAFDSCSNIKYVKIPKNVSDIESAIFTCCFSLEKIEVSEDNQFYSSDENGILYNKNKTKLIQYPNGNKEKTYIMDNSILSIENNSFYGSKYLESVTISKNVTVISSYAFCGCSSLNEVVLPERLKEIRSGAFESCYNLIEICIPESVEVIGFSAFNVTKLQEVRICNSECEISDEIYTFPSTATIYCLKDSTAQDYAEKNNRRLVTYDERETTDNAVEPTCTKAGLTEGKHCSVCGKITVPQQVISMINHDYKSTEGVLPTCTEKGYTTYTCTVCGDTQQKEIPATGHQDTYGTKGVGATCTEDGLTPGTFCRDCNTFIKGHEIVPALGHKEAVYSEMVPPTCTADGHTAETRCKVCGDVMTKSKVIHAIGHSDKNNDGFCDNCGTDLGTHNPADNCSHICHKTGFAGFIWKILNLFNKMFKTNKVCECGAKHY